MNWLEQAAAKNIFKTFDFEPLLKLEEYSADDESFVCEVLDIYLEVSPGQMAEIRESLKVKDLSTIQKLAHTLKSSHANIGALTIAKICADIEAATNFNAVPSLVAALETNYSAALAEFKQLRELNHAIKKSAS